MRTQSKKAFLRLFLGSWVLFGALFFQSAQEARAGIIAPLLEGAQVTAPGTFEAKLGADIIFNRGGGVNGFASFGTGFIEHMLDGEVYLGAGKTDFYVGARGKFNFLPDLPGQVAWAFVSSLSYVSDDSLDPDDTSKQLSILALSLGTIVSKAFDTSFGVVDPYVAFELEFLFVEELKNSVPLNLALGAEWVISDIDRWKFHSEFNISLDDSITYLALGASYRFQ